MRIVVVGGYAPSLLTFRGPLLAEMVRRGHDVVAMGAEGSPSVSARLDAIGVRFEEVPFVRAGLKAGQDARAFAHLLVRLRQLRPDVVLSYTIKPVIYGSLAARLVGVPRRVALITGLGFAFSTQASSARLRLVRTLAVRLLRLGLQQCDLVVFQNHDDEAELLRHALVPSSARRAVVRGSGVDLVHYAPASLPPRPLRFLFIGRLLADKGIREFIEAARAMKRWAPQVRFTVVGEVDANPASVTRSELDTWIREGLIDYVGFADDVRPHIAACHVLVLPSYREGTPRAVLEAMSMQRAVITTDAPGCRETVVHDESGILVPVRDPAAVLAAMKRTWDEPRLVETLAAAARARAVALYGANAVAETMLTTMAL